MNNVIMKHWQTPLKQTKHPPNEEKKEQRERGPKCEVEGQNPKWWSIRCIGTNHVPKPSLVILWIQHTYIKLSDFFTWKVM